MTNELTAVLGDIIGLSRKSQMSLTARALKGGEEQGELATAVLITTGEITHKKLDEAVSGEVADVIICALDVLAETNLELTPDEIIALLTSELQRKSSKWASVLARYTV